MFRVRAICALMLGVLLAAVAQAQQPMPPGMIQGPPMHAPMGPAYGGPMMGGPAMGGPMMGPVMGAPMQPAIQPMVAPAAFQDNGFGPVEQTGFACGGGGCCGDCGGGCGGGCFGGGHGGYGHGGYGDCGACGGCGCAVCCPPPGCPVCFNGEVEATILVPDLEGNLATGNFASPTVPALATFGAFDAELDEDDAILSPRIWLHAQKCEWGLGARIWYFDGTQTDITPFNLLQLNIFGDYAQERLYLLTADTELTYSWHPMSISGAAFQLSVGMRYVEMEHDALAFGSAVLADVVASTNAFAVTDYEGYGVTSGFRGTVPLWGYANLYWKIRGSYTTGDLMARTQTTATAVGNGDAAAAATAAGALTDDDLFIGEAQLGIQWQHDLVCVPARAFYRVAFEYQHWEFDDGLLASSTAQADVATLPGTIATAASSATARAPDFDLFGLSFGAGLTW